MDFKEKFNIRAYLQQNYPILTEEEILVFLRHHPRIEEEGNELKIFNSLGRFFQNMMKRSEQILGQINGKIADLERNKKLKLDKIVEIKKSLDQMSVVLQLENMPSDYNRGITFIENNLKNLRLGKYIVEYNPIITDLAYDVLQVCGFKREENEGKIIYRHSGEINFFMEKLLHILNNEFSLENFHPGEKQREPRVSTYKSSFNPIDLEEQPNDDESKNALPKKFAFQEIEERQNGRLFEFTKSQSILRSRESTDLFDFNSKGSKKRLNNDREGIKIETLETDIYLTRIPLDGINSRKVIPLITPNKEDQEEEVSLIGRITNILNAYRIDQPDLRSCERLCEYAAEKSEEMSKNNLEKIDFDIQPLTCKVQYINRFVYFYCSCLQTEQSKTLLLDSIREKSKEYKPEDWNCCGISISKNPKLKKLYAFVLLADKRDQL